MNPFLIRQFGFAFSLFAFSLFASSLFASAFALAAPPSFTVEVTGKGKPILFIPGLASSGEVWKDTVAQFSNRYECHVVTLAGFAGVAPVSTPLLPTVQKELVDYIDAKKLDRPIIVGHSLGGFLALRMGADTPSKVGRLVIVDSLPALGAVQVPDITPEQLKTMAARMRDAMKSQDNATFSEGQRRSVASMVTKPDDLERVLGWGRKSDGATVMNAMHDLIATDLRQDIERIKSPTLVLGTWIAYKEYATRAAVENTFKTQYQKLKGVTIEVAETARHFIMYDDPKWMYERMEKFLQ